MSAAWRRGAGQGGAGDRGRNGSTRAVSAQGTIQAGASHPALDLLCPLFCRLFLLLDQSYRKGRREKKNKLRKCPEKALRLLTSFPTLPFSILAYEQIDKNEQHFPAYAESCLKSVSNLGIIRAMCFQPSTFSQSCR